MHEGITYAPRQLTDADLPSLLALCESNPQYYRHLHETPTRTSLAESMGELPPRCSPNQKHFVGFFRGDELVAVMDLVLDYPNAGTAFIGFFMVDARHQRRGVGSQIVADTLGRFRAQGFLRVRLAYVGGNEQSRGASTSWASPRSSPCGRQGCQAPPALLDETDDRLVGLLTVTNHEVAVPILKTGTARPGWRWSGHSGDPHWG